jgi:hypothetical protein
MIDILLKFMKQTFHAHIFEEIDCGKGYVSHERCFKCVTCGKRRSVVDIPWADIY